MTEWQQTTDATWHGLVVYAVPLDGGRGAGLCLAWLPDQLLRPAP